MAFSKQIETGDIEQCPKLSQLTQLDANEREIRLIRLRDDIKVERYPLIAAPPYHAISYFWGPSTPTQQICVEGELVEMRESVSSLFEVIRMRYGDEARFWIDILCTYSDRFSIKYRRNLGSFILYVPGRTGALFWSGKIIT